MSGTEKQYGLIEPKTGKKLTVGDVFNNDSDSGGENEGNWMKKATQVKDENVVKRQTKLDMQKALEQDPTVYQYDEIYDDMNEKKKKQEKANVVSERKSKYIQNLIKTAEKRKKENERRLERQIQKEREAEGDMFKDKEEFITSSYKQKLEEFKKAEEEEKKMEYIEALMDVSKQKDLGGFYRHLYKETVNSENSKDDSELKNSDDNLCQLPNSENKTDFQTSDKLKHSARNYRKRNIEDSIDDTEKTRKRSHSSSSLSDSSSDSSSTSSSSSSAASKSKAENGINASSDGTAGQKSKEDDKSNSKKTNDEDNKRKCRNDVSNKRKESDRNEYGKFGRCDVGEREQQKILDRGGREKNGGDKRAKSKDFAGSKRRERSGEREREREKREEQMKNHKTDKYHGKTDNVRRRSSEKRDKSKSRRPSDDGKRQSNSDCNRLKGDKEKRNSVEEANNKNAKRKRSSKENENEKEEAEETLKVSIWEKRTVGRVFEEALERYKQRKAAIGS